MLTSNRVTNVLLILVLITGISIVAMLATRGDAGPLDPPGAPGSTDGVHGPGTPISSLPYTISQSGYYYVTRSLTGGTGQSGITIASSNVTLDLGGFTLFGGTTPGDGITANGPRYATVRNGSVRGWSTGINLVVTYSRIEGVRATNNVFNGIALGGLSTVTDCVASLNGQFGIVASNLTIRNCTMAENGTTGIRITGNAVLEFNRVNVSAGARGVEVEGPYSTLRSNEVTGPGDDIVLNSLARDTALISNVYCDVIDSGVNTFYTGNVDRVDNC